MQLVHDFVVPRPIESAWSVLTDLEQVAPCMPGAQLLCRLRATPIAARSG